MHGFGTHQRVQVKRGGNVMMTPIDDDYAFDHQRNYAMADTTINANDQIRSHVHLREHDQSDGRRSIEGDNYSTEMCLTGFDKYPAGGLLEDCVSQQPL